MWMTLCEYACFVITLKYYLKCMLYVGDINMYGMGPIASSSAQDMSSDKANICGCNTSYVWCINVCEHQ